MLGSGMLLFGARDRIQNAGASVVVNPDGSVSITPASGKSTTITSGALNILSSAGVNIAAGGEVGIGKNDAGLSFFTSFQYTALLLLGLLTIGQSQFAGIAFSPGTPPGRDTYLLRDGAANTLAQRNGTNPQVYRLYNTFTDASNFERGGFRWVSNALQVFTEWAGTGQARPLMLVSATNLIPIGGLTKAFPALRYGRTGVGNALEIIAADESAYVPIVVQALRVNNAQPGTTLGSVVRKIEVFDPLGNSLGFVPVYNSIT